MSALKIIVCMKQVADPEAPSSAFDIDGAARRVVAHGIPPVINPFDASALEAALTIKDKMAAHITVVTMIDDKLAMAVLRKALAAGADDLVILEDPLFLGLDAFSTAYVLASAIRGIGAYSLILTGRQTADWGSGSVGMIIAEMLGIPGINLARRIDIDGGRLVVERIRRSGSAVVRAAMPALVAADSEIGELRLPLLKDIKEATAKPVAKLSASMLRIDGNILRVREISDLLPSPSRRRTCCVVEGRSPQERGEKLALKLREDRVI